MSAFIQVRNARTHNLKGVDLDIPRNQVVVFTGVSGSGKSSLVFDTLYAEAQRQLVETFSAFARRRLPTFPRPDVDDISNLSTGIVIDQKRMGRTLRSTVGTATEVYTYLRLLFARCATPSVEAHRYSFNHPEGMCSECRGLGRTIRIDPDKMVDPTRCLQDGAITHPDYKVGGFHWRKFTSNGLFDPDLPLGEWTPEQRHLLLHAEDVQVEGEHRGVSYSGTWLGLIRRLERFYQGKAEDEASAKDAYQRYLVHADCVSCGGTRLCAEVLEPKLNGLNIAELCALELDDLDDFLAGVHHELAGALVRKMRRVLGQLIEIGVGYLTLSRAVATLSGGESQRVKMARQLDCDLTGLMYVLDEPSIGLHPRDLHKLLVMVRRLCDRGNSVLVVEHDPSVIQAADYIVDIGPEAGAGGGKICFEGEVKQLLTSDTVTGRALRRRQTGHRKVRSPSGWFAVRGANVHNLVDLDVDVPLGVLTCVTGVAGSGKSTLIHEVFVKHHPDAVVIDQSPVGRSSRSNTLTYTGAFGAVRKGFAKASGQPASLFSFNSRGGCEDCKGSGLLKVEMGFMDDIDIPCSTCAGRRYRPEVLVHRWNGANIYDVLCMTVDDALQFFEARAIRRPLEVLARVGLGYLQIGQPLSTLSGGEAQRLKLASELQKQGRIYVMDEPTTGLHVADTRRFLGVVQALVDAGNSVVIIEHDLEVIAAADWVIDLGPEGGKGGGRLVVAGTPSAVAQCEDSQTGRYLRAASTRSLGSDTSSVARV